MRLLYSTILLMATMAAHAQEPQADSTKSERTETVIIDKRSKGSDIEMSQMDSTKADTTLVRIGKKKFVIITDTDDDKDGGGSVSIDSEDDGNPGESSSCDRKHELSWWSGIDLGVNGIMSADYDTDLGDEFGFLEPRYGQSRYISFNFPEFKARLIGDYVGLTTGMSVQFYNFKYGGDKEFVFGGDSLYAVPTGDKNVTKNKLRATYFAIPLMLEFNTSQVQSKSFHLSAGVVGKVLIGDMYKQKYDLNGDSNKLTLKGDLGLNRWGADAMVRVGYGWFTLYAQVGLTPLFDNANTPDMYTGSAGIFFKI